MLIAAAAGSAQAKETNLTKQGTTAATYVGVNSRIHTKRADSSRLRHEEGNSNPTTTVSNREGRGG